MMTLVEATPDLLLRLGVVKDDCRRTIEDNIKAFYVEFYKFHDGSYKKGFFSKPIQLISPAGANPNMVGIQKLVFEELSNEYVAWKNLNPKRAKVIDDAKNCMVFMVDFIKRIETALEIGGACILTSEEAELVKVAYSRPLKKKETLDD